LSELEQLQLRAYALFKKHRTLPDLSDETLTAFAREITETCNTAQVDSQSQSEGGSDE
jgi:hypothetical protein